MNNLEMAMTTTDNSAIIASQILESGVLDDSKPKSGSEVIETRFGKVKISYDNPIVFGKGILGMPDKSNFCVVDFPVEKFSQFKLLQSLDDNELSFIALPIDIENQFIDRQDIEDSCSDLGISLSNLAVLLIVSVHREVNNVRLSANSRAPIFIDSANHTAEQYVLRNNKYVVRHAISTN